MSLDIATFNKCIQEIVTISNSNGDGWTLEEKLERENGKYLTKKLSEILKNETGEIIVMFEYHLAYHISYSVPILCFNAWKQDGSILGLEEYCKYNKKFSDQKILTTLTQLDHPVLCRPFLTLHPCHTSDILQTFMGKSKNPIISWLTVIGPYLNLSMADNYIKNII